MITKLDNTSKVKQLFNGWEETLITSCLQKVMGEIIVDNENSPTSAMARIGAFDFLAGEPNEELLLNRDKGFTILIPQNEKWSEKIRSTYCNEYSDKYRCEINEIKRYAIRKDTKFDIERLKQLASDIPHGYEIRKIEDREYDDCLKEGWSEDLVSVFKTKENYKNIGLGYVAYCGNELSAGASSYTRYNEGIEIEVDTKMDHRRKHLATVCSANLILECLDRGLYPSWDAQNLNSVALSKKLGYEFSHEYTAFELLIK